jgi:putative FmdB family regulatory protein
MPMYEFRCSRCNRRMQDLFKVDECPKLIECPCGGLADRVVSLIANTTSQWGDSHGYYDRGLGTYVENAQHRERVMKKRGLVSLQDYDKNYVEDRLEKRQDVFDQHERDVRDYKQYRELGRSKGEAMAEVYNTERLTKDGLME